MVAPFVANITKAADLGNYSWKMDFPNPQDFSSKNTMQATMATGGSGDRTMALSVADSAGHVATSLAQPIPVGDPGNMNFSMAGFADAGVDMTSVTGVTMVVDEGSATTGAGFEVHRMVATNT